MAINAAGNTVNTSGNSSFNTLTHQTLDTSTSLLELSMSMDNSELTGRSAVDNFLDIHSGYPSYESISPFSKPFKDSIKQDVMLSSAVGSDGTNNNMASESLYRDDGGGQPPLKVIYATKTSLPE